MPTAGHPHVRLQRQPIGETHEQMFANGLYRLDDRPDLRSFTLDPWRAEFPHRLTDQGRAQACGTAMDGVAFGHSSS
jgi:hypothetical protein